MAPDCRPVTQIDLAAEGGCASQIDAPAGCSQNVRRRHRPRRVDGEEEVGGGVLLRADRVSEPVARGRGARTRLALHDAGVLAGAQPHDADGLGAAVPRREQRRRRVRGPGVGARVAPRAHSTS